VGVLGVLLAGRAWAQAPSDPRSDYEAGVRELHEGRYQEAVRHLERSYAARAVPVVLYNLALSYRGVGRYQDAIGAFERYLSAAEPSATAERLAAIRGEVEGLRGQLARVLLTVTPPGASLHVDGRPVEGTATELVLDPRAHTLTWSAPGHHDAQRDLEARPGETVRLVVALEPQREGRLVVEPSVPDAVVRIDGELACAGRCERRLPPGVHRVELSAPGHRPFRREVRVGTAGVVRVDATLARETPRWVLPVAIGGGVLLAGAAVLATVALVSPAAPTPYQASWDNVLEPREP
jgi:hypothetical protein